MSDATLSAPGADTTHQVQVLDALPSVGSLLAQGALTSFGRAGAAAGLPTRRLEVHGVEQDRVRLADYARVCGVTLRDAVPPTWLHVLCFPLHVQLMAGRDFPFPMAGMVHVANAMSLLRPVQSGEALDLSVGVESLRPHRRGSTVDLVSEVSVAGEPVWRGVSTYLAKHAPSGDAEGERSEASNPGDAADAADAADDKTAGLVRAGQWRLPAELGRRYAAVSGDVNPIHLSALSAKALGFPRAIVHGMWTQARALAALDGRLPAAYDVKVRFGKPVLLPSTVELSVAREPDGWRFAVTNRDGSTRHLTGRVTDR